MTSLNSIESDLQTGLIDVDFNEEAKLQAVIKGDGLDYVGKIIDSKGDIVCDVEFGLESILPPSAKKFIEAYLYSKEQNIYIMEAVYILSKQNNEKETCSNQ